MGNPMPVVSHFRDDFLYNLVLIEDTDTMDVVAEKCAEHSVGRRVAHRDSPMRVEYLGNFLDSGSTVLDVGIVPMGELIVSYSDR